MREILTRQRTTTFLAHLLCISIFFILPEVLANISNPGRPIKPWVYTKTLIIIGVFYINYYWIIEHSFGKSKRLIRFFGWNIILCVVSLTLFYLIWRFRDFFGGKPPLRNYDSPTEWMYLAKSMTMLSRDFVMLILVIGFATALRLGDEWLKLDRRRKDLLSAQREEELKNLKSQLNPHFLFNTLNSIYALIAISPQKAQDAVHELSRLLRYVLYDTSATVSFRQELGFIDNYINLMRLRLNPAVKLDVTLNAGDNESLRIAPLLFITLIENVFKHGIYTPEIPLRISITADGNQILCTTSNGRQPSADDSGKSPEGGIGMSNLRRRLDLIYGRQATIDIDQTPETYKVTLRIDLDSNRQLD